MPRILFFLGIAICGFAQQPGDLSIAGVVVNSLTGEPIKRAQVSLWQTTPPDRSRTGGGLRPASFKQSSVFTDSAGTFRFAALTASSVMLSVQKPGFAVEQQQRAMLSLNLTSSKEDLRLTLQPLAVITGKVVDQDGLPIRGVNIIALTLRMVDGLRQSQPIRNGTTDDRGMYRFWNLQPGKYYVKAAGKSGGTNLYAGETAPRVLGNQSFAPAYFGGASTLDGAQPVTIEPGAEARADFNLTMQPAFKIRGSLANFVPRRTVKFELLSGDEDVGASRVSVNGDTGTFQILDVVPGNYTVRATQGSTNAEIPLNVGGADVDGIALQLLPGVDIPLRIQIIGTAPAAVSREFDRVLGCTLSLSPPGRRAGNTYHSAPMHDSAARGETSPSINGVLGGAYRAGIHCAGAYVQSMRMGTQDLLANPILTIQPGVPPTPIDITGASGGGTVTGDVSVEGGKKDSDLLIVLVPQFTPSTGPLTSLWRTGKFFFTNLAPGSYTMYAYSDPDAIEYRNPAFVESLSGGTPVQVQDKQQVSVTIPRLVR